MQGESSVASQLETEVELESAFPPPVFRPELVIGYQRLKGGEDDAIPERRWPSPTRTDALDRAKSPAMRSLSSLLPEPMASTPPEQRARMPNGAAPHTPKSTPTRHILASFMRSLSTPMKKKKARTPETGSAECIGNPFSSESSVGSVMTPQTPHFRAADVHDSFAYSVTPYKVQRPMAPEHRPPPMNPDTCFPQPRFAAQIIDRPEPGDSEEAGPDNSAAKAWRYNNKRRRSSPGLVMATDLHVVHEVDGFHHAGSLPQFVCGKYFLTPRAFTTQVNYDVCRRGIVKVRKGDPVI